MQIGNRIDGIYGVPYLFNDKVMEDAKESDVVSHEEENEPVQIGARAYTDKEWDAFLKKFDSVQNTVKELMRERHDKLEKEKINRERINKEKLEEKLDEEKRTKKTILESKSYSYPTDNLDGEVVLHVTQYVEKGIVSRNAGKIEKYEWAIPFETFRSNTDSI